MQTIYIPLAILLLDYFIPYYKKSGRVRSVAVRLRYGSGRVRSGAVGSGTVAVGCGTVAVRQRSGAVGSGTVAVRQRYGSGAVAVRYVRQRLVAVRCGRQRSGAVRQQDLSTYNGLPFGLCTDATFHCSDYFIQGAIDGQQIFFKFLSRGGLRTKELGREDEKTKWRPVLKNFACQYLGNMLIAWTPASFQVKTGLPTGAGVTIELPTIEKMRYIQYTHGPTIKLVSNKRCDPPETFSNVKLLVAKQLDTKIFIYIYFGCTLDWR